MIKKAKDKLKWVYYVLGGKLLSRLFPKQYKFEYEFFQKIQGNAYYDLSFMETKLRILAHNIDKTLLLANFQKREGIFNKLSDLIKQVSDIPSHDEAMIKWSKNIVSEYKCRREGKSPSCGKPKRFDRSASVFLRDMIKSRRSIRSFKSESLSETIVDQILISGLWAPTGCNRQTIEYLLLEDKEDVLFCQKIAGEGLGFPTESPLNIIVLVDARLYALPNQRHMVYLEGGAAIQNMLIVSQSLNVGSCWLFWSNKHNTNSEFINRFGLKPWLLPIAMVCLGYPERYPKFPPIRKKLANSIHKPNRKKGSSNGRKEY